MPPPSTRKKTAIFLVGQPEPDLPSHVLPTHHDVLKFMYHQVKKGGAGKTVARVMCCPLKSGENMARCHEEGGCSFVSSDSSSTLADENLCVTAAVKKRWSKAGLKTIWDEGIR